MVKSVGRAAAAGAAVLVATAGLIRAGQTNPTTSALAYLVLILFVASGWGIGPAMCASLVAVGAFNYFFLPPVGTWTIADPQNWVAFAAFLATAVVASQLSGRARARELEALDRQRRLEQLYSLSRALLLTDPSTAPASVAQRIAETFDLRSVALYDARTDRLTRGGTGDLTGVDALLRDVARQAASARVGGGVTVTAIRLGGAPIGSVALPDAGLSDTVVQSIANLAAIALERARGHETAARAEAARQSGELRATVLDALAHEFKTPLTSLKMASSDLQTHTSLGPGARELAAIIDEDVTRLDGLVSDVVRMLRIDAGDFVLRAERHRLADLIGPVLATFARRLEGHQVRTQVPPDLVVAVDGDLLSLAVRQLIDNALKYSPPSSTIALEARTNGTVILNVSNTGSHIPGGDLDRVFDRFYRGSASGRVPGTGIGLSIVRTIAEAHGGRVAVSSDPATGTSVTLTLPKGDPS